MEMEEKKECICESSKRITSSHQSRQFLESTEEFFQKSPIILIFSIILKIIHLFNSNALQILVTH